MNGRSGNEKMNLCGSVFMHLNVFSAWVERWRREVIYALVPRKVREYICYSSVANMPGNIESNARFVVMSLK